MWKYKIITLTFNWQCRFAVDEAALAIASFIRKYKYSLDPEKHPADSKLQFHCGLTVIPKGGVWIKLDPVQD